jgi:cell division transport system ATP-binding protein
VAVARAIAGNPKIIVADEPTGSLDADSARVIMGLLKLYHRRGATVIIATHDTALIRQTGGRVILLNDGYLEVSTVIPKLRP